MAKILLDYAFPITQITPTPNASTGFLKVPLVVVKPKAGQEGNVGEVYECTNMAQVEARTANVEAQQLFNAGLTRLLLLLADDLDLEDVLTEHAGTFFTVLISSDFDDDDLVGVKAAKVVGDLTFTAVGVGAEGNNITIALVNSTTAGNESVTVDGMDIIVAMEGGESTAQQIANAINASEAALALVTVEIASGEASTKQAAAAEAPLAGGQDPIALGTFKGVTGVYSSSLTVARAQAGIENRSSFYANAINKAKNMFFAFGSILSNPSNWVNQQYIQMPFDDGVDELGEAITLFEDGVSFVIHDDEFQNRLALFAAGKKAITAPYIKKNLSIDLQSRALQWISANMPDYTVKEATLLESDLQERVIDDYIDRRRWLSGGTVEITINPIGNFTAKGNIEIPQPKALWRVESELRESI